VKTVRICFKRPDRRAGQMVELDEVGAQREIDNGTAEAVSDEEWTAYQRQLAELEKKEKAPAPAPAAKKAHRSK
jgi:threonine synthase